MAIDWEREVRILQDMATTAAWSHTVTAEALTDRMNAVEHRSDGIRDQKIALVKLAAEVISSLEDVVALAWAVGKRSNGGIVRQYLRYEGGDVGKMADRLITGEDIVLVLRLPDRSRFVNNVNPDEMNRYDAAISELQASLVMTAKNYRVQNGRLVKAYNKSKHGFVVVEDIRQFMGGQPVHLNWEQHIHVLLAPGDYVPIELSEDNVLRLVQVTRMSAITWTELAHLVQWYWEHGIPLDLGTS
jgi:hypothetical protein